MQAVLQFVCIFLSNSWEKNSLINTYDLLSCPYFIIFDNGQIHALLRQPTNQNHFVCAKKYYLNILIGSVILIRIEIII